MIEYYEMVYAKQKEIIEHFKTVVSTLKDIRTDICELNEKIDINKAFDYIDNNLEKVFEKFVEEYPDIARTDEFMPDNMFEYENEMLSVAKKLIEEKK